jgi:hypothetical protein
MINVDTVYKTVLLILNKEQRGYMTPDEFNKTATKVQLDIFEQYFESLNQQLRVSTSDVDYADRQRAIDEKLAPFKKEGVCNKFEEELNLNQDFTTTDHWTFQAGDSVSNNAMNLNGDGSRGCLSFVPVVGRTYTAKFEITNYSSGNIAVFDGAGGVRITDYLDGTANDVPQEVTWTQTSTGNNYFNFYSSVGFVGQIKNISIKEVNSKFLLPRNRLSGEDTILYEIGSANSTQSHFYKLGTVSHFSDTTGVSTEIEIVSRSDFFNLQKSDLTMPSESSPICLYENGGLTVAPLSIQYGVLASFLVKPKDVVWGYDIGGFGQFVHNPSGSNPGSLVKTQNFELHPSEQSNVINRILFYSGVIIKDPQVAQAAAMQIQQEETNKKS